MYSSYLVFSSSPVQPLDGPLYLCYILFASYMGRKSQPHDEQRDTQYKGLKLLKDCPVCQTAFQTTDIRIVDTYDNAHLLHLTCSECSHALLSIFAISQMGMSSVGMATDLSAFDAERVLNTEPIHEDEVLSFHTLLSKQTHHNKPIEHLFVIQE